MQVKRLRQFKHIEELQKQIILSQKDSVLPSANKKLKQTNNKD